MIVDTFQAGIIEKALRAQLPDMADDERPEAIGLVVKCRKVVLTANMQRELADLESALRADDFIDHCSYLPGRIRRESAYVQSMHATDSLDDDNDE